MLISWQNPLPHISPTSFDKSEERSGRYDRSMAIMTVLYAIANLGSVVRSRDTYPYLIIDPLISTSDQVL